MAIKSKVYSYLKRYLDEYLYGFEKDQLDVALMSGQVNLLNANFRPQKVNSLLSKLGIPFSMKAGLIGKLTFKYHYTSFLSSPLELELSELLVVLGPMMNEPVVDNGQLRSPDSDEDFPESLFLYPEEDEDEDYEVEDEFEEERSFLQNYFTKILKNLTLVIHTLVIRFEDEVHSYNHPYACGLSIPKIQIRNTSKMWETSETGENVPVKPPRQSTVKDIKLQKATVYVSSMSSMLIPTAVWEDTLGSPIGIFEAIAAYEIREMILEEVSQVVQEPEKLLVAPSDLNCCLALMETGASRCSIELGNLKIKVSSAMAECFRNFQDYYINSKLWGFMAAYRPKFNIPLIEDCPKKSQKKYRKRIIQQWFKYALKFARAKVQLRKYIEHRKDRGMFKKQQEEDKNMDLVMGGKQNCEHFSKWLVNSSYLISVSSLSIQFFSEEQEGQLNLEKNFISVNGSDKELEYFVSFNKVTCRMSDTEVLRWGRAARTEEKVNEGIFRTSKNTVVIKQPSHAFRCIARYRPEAIRGLSKLNMYEFQIAMSRMHLKYSPNVLSEAIDIYEAFKLNKILRDTFVRVKRKNERELIRTFEKKTIELLKKIARWAELKEKQLLFADFYCSVKSRGANVKLIDNASSCKLFVPPGEILLAKDERITLLRAWQLQITTYDSLNGIFTYLKELNHRISQKIQLAKMMVERAYGHSK